MNKKLLCQSLALLLLTAALCNAQAVGGGGPVEALKAIARILLGCVTWIGVIGLIWHCIGMLFDREHFGGIVKWAIGTGIAFGAYYLVGLVSASSLATF